MASSVDEDFSSTIQSLGITFYPYRSSDCDDSCGDKEFLDEMILFFGSQKMIAHLIGVSKQTISNWYKNGKVPSLYAKAIRKTATDYLGEITR